MKIEVGQIVAVKNGNSLGRNSLPDIPIYVHIQKICDEKRFLGVAEDYSKEVYIYRNDEIMTKDIKRKINNRIGKPQLI